MRNKLKEYSGKRLRFVGIFSRFGKKAKFKGGFQVTLLIRNIILEGFPEEEVTDHFWFNYTKQFQNTLLRNGTILAFNARVGQYEKGYSEDSEENPKRLDFGLYYPSKVEIVGQTIESPLVDVIAQQYLLEMYCREQMRLMNYQTYLETKNQIDNSSEKLSSVKERGFQQRKLTKWNQT